MEFTCGARNARSCGARHSRARLAAQGQRPAPRSPAWLWLVVSPKRGQLQQMVWLQWASLNKTLYQGQHCTAQATGMERSFEGDDKDAIGSRFKWHGVSYSTMSRIRSRQELCIWQHREHLQRRKVLRGQLRSCSHDQYERSGCATRVSTPAELASGTGTCRRPASLDSVCSGRSPR